MKYNYRIKKLFSTLKKTYFQICTYLPTGVFNNNKLIKHYTDFSIASNQKKKLDTGPYNVSTKSNLSLLCMF